MTRLGSHSGNLNKSGGDLHCCLTLDDLEGRLRVENEGGETLGETDCLQLCPLQFIPRLGQPLRCQHTLGALSSVSLIAGSLV